MHWLSGFLNRTIVFCFELEDVQQIALNDTLKPLSKRTEIVFALPKSGATYADDIIACYPQCQIVYFDDQHDGKKPGTVASVKKLLEAHTPLFVIIALGKQSRLSEAVYRICRKEALPTLLVQTSEAETIGKGQFNLKRKTDIGIFRSAECAEKLLGKSGVESGIRFILDESGGGDNGAAIDRLLFRTVEPLALKARRKVADKRVSISHHQGANLVLSQYAGIDKDELFVHGYWIHGWHPPYHSVDPIMVALHKKDGVPPAELAKLIPQEQETEYQYVTRQDQVDFLLSHGYKKVRAIGLPFAYLPASPVTRKPGTMVILPPHGRKKHFENDSTAEEYAEAIVKIRGEFDEIWLGLTEGDYVRGEWLYTFADAGIKTIISNNPFDENPLARTKDLFSLFDVVTTNGFGSHIPYAAVCGAKISVHGPRSEWELEAIRKINACKMKPHLEQALATANSVAELERHYPFLFVPPNEAERHEDWGKEQIGYACRLSPEEVRSIFARPNGTGPGVDTNKRKKQTSGELRGLKQFGDLLLRRLGRK